MISLQGEDEEEERKKERKKRETKTTTKKTNAERRFRLRLPLGPPPDHSTIRFRLIYSLSCSLANDAICITHCPFFFLSLTLTTNSPFMIPFCFTFCWFFFYTGLSPRPQSSSLLNSCLDPRFSQ